LQEEAGVMAAEELPMADQKTATLYRMILPEET
jgi:hypothetical protein